MKKSPFDHTSARGHDEEMEEWREDMVEEEEEDKEEGENEMVGDENRERGESTGPRTEKRGNRPRGRRMDRENKNKVGVRRGMNRGAQIRRLGYHCICCPFLALSPSTTPLIVHH